jgi:hypothetical protein
MDRVEELRNAIIGDRCKGPVTWDDVALLLCRLDEAREKAAEEAFNAVHEVYERSSTPAFQMGVRAAHHALRRVFG